MNRRRLLVGAGSLGSSLLAGCLGGEDSSGAGTATSTETETTMTTSATTTRTSARESTTLTGTDEPTTRSETLTSTESPASQTTDGTRTTSSPTRSSTASGPSAIVDRAITVGDRTCGNPTDEGTVAFEDERVVVTGTITGSDSCATAVLDEATYEDSTDRLRVVIATESAREEGTTCAQCLTEIDYEATIAFAEEAPETVVLVHRGATGETRITTATA